MSESDRIDLPPGFEARARELLGGELDAFLAALAAPSSGLRVNTLRLAHGRFRELAPFELIPLAHPAGGFVVVGDARPGIHPYHAAGLYYLQDPGAMVVGAMVDPRPGERVLDLAAAPGGKATHLAARMAGRGLLVANDVHPGRARELAGNLERFGMANAVVTAADPERLAARFGDSFDRVLVDAPCSGESMFHKSAAARSDWSPAAVAGCARRQVELMSQAAGLVRPGGLLVYSTCTFSPEENEETVARFLAAHPEFAVERLDAPAGAAPGVPEWVPEDLRRDDLGLSVRLWPHRVAGAGHFVAGLRRSGGSGDGPGRPVTLGAATEAGTVSASASPVESPGRAGGPAPSCGGQAAPIGQEAPVAAVEAWHALRDLLRISGPALADEAERRLVLLGEGLFLLPEGLPDLGGLRVISPGLRLGTFRKGRLDPAHALAMALDPRALAHPVALASGDPRVEAYLRGETVRHDGPDGWTVVTVDGFSLGWGKRVRGTVKNHYPKGLRSSLPTRPVDPSASRGTSA